MSVVKEMLAYFGIQVDDKDVLKADKSIQGLVETVKKVAVVAGAGAVVGGINTMIERVSIAGDGFAKAALKADLSIEKFQAYAFAAGRAGVSTETFTHSITALQKNALEVANGSQEAAKGFKKIGVSVKDGNGQLKDGETLFMEVADGLASIENESLRAALSMELLGRGGKELRPLIDQGSAGVRGLISEFEELGGGISAQTVKDSEELRDSTENNTAAYAALEAKLVRDLIPAKTWLIKKFTQVAKWASANEGRLKTLTGVMLGLAGVTSAVGVAMAGKVLAPFAMSMITNVKRATIAIWGWGRAVAGIAAMKGGLKYLGAAAWTAMKPFLTVGLIVAGLVAIGLIIEDIIVLFQGGESAIGAFLDEMFGIGTAQEVVYAVKQGWDDLIDTIATAIDYVVEFVKIVAGAPGKAVDFVTSALPGGEGFSKAFNATKGFLGIGGDDAVPAAAQFAGAGGASGVSGNGMASTSGGSVPYIPRAASGGSSVSIQSNLTVNANGTDPKAVAREVEIAARRQRATELRNAEAALKVGG